MIMLHLSKFQVTNLIATDEYQVTKIYSVIFDHLHSLFDLLKTNPGAELESPSLNSSKIKDTNSSPISSLF